MADSNFFDDFNRADGAPDNGWLQALDCDSLLISGGALTTQLTTGGLFRPIDLSGAVTVSADATQENGFGGLLDRYGALFLLGSDGHVFGPTSGYGIEVYRGDQNYPSYVILFYNGQPIDTVASTFQYGAALHVTFTMDTDGSIVGAISGDGNTFDFSFGPRAVVFAGSDFVMGMGAPDGRSATLTYPTIDNLQITSAAPVADSIIATSPAPLVGDELWAYGSNLYFVDASPGVIGSIYQVAQSGRVPSLLADNIGPQGDGGGPGNLIFSGNTVYFDGGNYISSQIQSVPVSGGAISTIGAPFSGGILLATDGSSLYYSSNFQNISAVPISGGASTTLATGLWPRRNVSDSSGVYFQDYYTGNVDKLTFATGQVSAIATSLPRDSLIAEDTDNLYFGTPSAIDSVSKSGGVPTIVVAADPVSLTVGGGEVYYTDGTSIYGVPTPGGNTVVVDFVQTGGIKNLTYADGNLFYSVGSNIYQAPTVAPVNQPPIIVSADSTGTINENPFATNATQIDSTAGKIEFEDPDLGDMPTASIVSQSVQYQGADGTIGSLSPDQIALFESAFQISPEAGNTNSGVLDWVYAIADKALDFLGLGETAKVQSNVQIDDGRGGTTNQLVTVQINGADDSPIATPDAAMVQKGSTTSGNVLTNDSDPDIHDLLRVSSVNGLTSQVGVPITGQYGSLDLNSDGSYIYTADPSRSGVTDSFSYTVSDGHGGLASSMLDISILSPSQVHSGPHLSPPPPGSITLDLATAKQAMKDAIASGTSVTHPFLLTDRSQPTIVKQLISDVASFFGTTPNYYSYDPSGYIDPTAIDKSGFSWEQCVALVAGLDKNIQVVTSTQSMRQNGVVTSDWCEGAEPEQVVPIDGNNPDLTYGTPVPIATFGADGRYNQEHAAIFLGYDTMADQSGKAHSGFWMLDQQPPGSTSPEPAELRFYAFDLGNPSVEQEYYKINVANPGV